ncbi:MAG: hypothetical protein ABJA37_04345 [Ferruginibacter sp.]
MKIEQLIVQYLYNHKKVTLQDIGSFSISPDIIVPSDNEKETALPPDAILFEYNNKATQDDGLIDFVVQQTRKIKPLATSDVESYSILSKQFLNIGKPLIIEGLGTLVKTQQGIYEFIQGNTISARLEAAPVQMKEKLKEEIIFTTPVREPSSKKGWLVALIGLFIVLAGIAVFYFLRNPNKDNSVEKIEAVPDTVAVSKPEVPVVIDTSSKIITDTTKTAVLKNDGYSFKVVIKEYSSKEAAQRAYARLTNYGHTLILSNVDSTHYKLSIPFTTALSDTLRAKDSLSKFFQSKAYIDLN